MNSSERKSPTSAWWRVSGLGPYKVGGLDRAEVLRGDEEELSVLHVLGHVQQQVDRQATAHRVHCTNQGHKAFIILSAIKPR